MKKQSILLILSLAVAASLFTGCGKKEKESETTAPSESKDLAAVMIEEEEEVPSAEEEPEEKTEVVEEFIDEIPEGMYRSELNGTFVREEIRNQRPIAVMVDNERTALPHFGLNDADVIYELMNSTANDRITRLMCVVKDWGNIKQFGSIRSTRPTNIPLAAEWNAVLIHDGGPFYINDWLAKDYSNNFSGGFGRVSNGKAREFTEYILTGELEKRFANSKYTTEYNEHYPMGNDENGERQSHFHFNLEGTNLSDMPGVIDCKEIVLPFKHNNSTLKYNENTNTYDYYVYGNAHNDGSTGEILTFKNVIIQDTEFVKLDDNGYLIYNVIDNSGMPGYYITNGKAIPIKWYKNSDTDVTRFFDENNNQIEVNVGKTYISLVPSDSWDDLSIK